MGEGDLPKLRIYLNTLGWDNQSVNEGKAMFVKEKRFETGTLTADRTITPYQQIVLKALEKICAAYGVALIYPNGLGLQNAATIEIQVFVPTISQ